MLSTERMPSLQTIFRRGNCFRQLVEDPLERQIIKNNSVTLRDDQVAEIARTAQRVVMRRHARSLPQGGWPLFNRLLEGIAYRNDTVFGALVHLSQAKIELGYALGLRVLGPGDITLNFGSTAEEEGKEIDGKEQKKVNEPFP